MKQYTLERKFVRSDEETRQTEAVHQSSGEGEHARSQTPTARHGAETSTPPDCAADKQVANQQRQ